MWVSPALSHGPRTQVPTLWTTAWQMYHIHTPSHSYSCLVPTQLNTQYLSGKPRVFCECQMTCSIDYNIFKKSVEAQLSHLCHPAWVLIDCVKKCHIVFHLVKYSSVKILWHPGHLKGRRFHFDKTCDLEDVLLPNWNWMRGKTSSRSQKQVQLPKLYPFYF